MTKSSALHEDASGLIRRPVCLAWWQLIISNIQEILFPSLARETAYSFITPCLGFSRCHTKRWIGRHHFDGIINPWYEALMHGRWNAAIGMNPIRHFLWMVWIVSWSQWWAALEFSTCFLGRPASPRPVGLALACLGPSLPCHIDPGSCDASQVCLGLGQVVCH